MFDIVLICRKPRQLPPMRVQIFTPNRDLEPVNDCQSCSRKITTRYLLKPIIRSITYFHSMLRQTDSKRPEDVPRIITQFALFFFIDI